PPGPFTVRVSEGEHLRSRLVGVTLGDDLRITLVPGGVVEGEVVAGSGGALRGARITLVDAAGERHTATVDGAGRFRVAGCAGGAATVTAEAPGCVTATATVELAAADWPGEVVLRDVRFALLEAGHIAGTVLDARGLPVAGAE